MVHSCCLVSPVQSPPLWTGFFMRVLPSCARRFTPGGFFFWCCTKVAGDASRLSRVGPRLPEAIFCVWPSSLRIDDHRADPGFEWDGFKLLYDHRAFAKVELYLSTRRESGLGRLVF